MIKNIKRIFIVGGFSFFSILFFALFVFFKNNISVEVLDKNTKEFAVEKYLLTKESDAYLRSSESQFFCEVEILWEYDLPNQEKVVYALNKCMSVILKDGDLRGESGGENPPLFKLIYKDNNWLVIDSDNRTTSPKEPITQDWVKDAESKIPTSIRKNKCFSNNCFSTKGLIDKAAKYFNVKLPQYPLNLCKNNSNCNEKSICVFTGDHSNQGSNICVQKCKTNSDCGTAHTCRYQCVHGENGCPDTSEKICIPDLLSPDIEKDPHSFVGFDDFDISRRQYIESTYPEFTVDYEKKPCFGGCSVKVIEDSRNYYYSFITHGSGLPILTATCFRVNPRMEVSKIGEFPELTDSYLGYRDINPKSCKGIK